MDFLSTYLLCLLALQDPHTGTVDVGEVKLESYRLYSQCHIQNRAPIIFKPHLLGPCKVSVATGKTHYLRHFQDEKALADRTRAPKKLPHRLASAIDDSHHGFERIQARRGL